MAVAAFSGSGSSSSIDCCCQVVQEEEQQQQQQDDIMSSIDTTSITSNSSTSSINIDSEQQQQQVSRCNRNTPTSTNTSCNCVSLTTRMNWLWFAAAWTGIYLWKGIGVVSNAKHWDLLDIELVAGLLKYIGAKVAWPALWNLAIVLLPVQHIVVRYQLQYYYNNNNFVLPKTNLANFYTTASISLALRFAVHALLITATYSIWAAIAVNADIHKQDEYNNNSNSTTSTTPIVFDRRNWNPKTEIIYRTDFTCKNTALIFYVDPRRTQY